MGGSTGQTERLGPGLPNHVVLTCGTGTRGPSGGSGLGITSSYGAKSGCRSAKRIRRSPHYERGLAYYEVELSGHTVPVVPEKFSPALAAYEIMEYLLGFRKKAMFRLYKKVTRRRREED
ncbi:hypothetical protein FOMPIDRAFT_1055221 [Fomitopsis schrenkii]|uniref:Uncharacterized protein n=1 Tax=Fomitopsis schrenkii TaxID=2126942 RepID=S8DST4_FOMSC|nr:hypothetical protein FOMPIDRAFT_1055221 [Fomitopsis schrenkii]